MQVQTYQSFKNTIIQHQTYFWCGCGVQTSSMEDFRDHSLDFHDGDYIDGSTHYLTSFIQVVLPVQNIRTFTETPQKVLYFKPNQKCQEGGKSYIENIDKPTLSLKVEADLKKNKSKQKQTQKVNRHKQKKIKNKAKSTIITSDQKQSTSVEKGIQWNGFALTRNKECSERAYFCGSCMMKFSEVEDFVVHCLNVCQELNNLQSSHFITFKENQQQAINEQRAISLKQNITENHQNIVINQQRHQIQWKFTEISSMLKKKKSKINTFYCGFCNKTLTHHIQIHITNAHSQIIHPSSSHIILRFPTDKIQKQEKYLVSLTNDWSQYGDIFYCPCKQDVKMTMQELFQHVMIVHKGISPIYKKTANNQDHQIVANTQQNLQSQKIQQKIQDQMMETRSINTKLAFLHEMLKNPYFSHLGNSYRIVEKINKMFPLRCFICQQDLCIRKYSRHFFLHRHDNINRQSFSHIILPIKLKKFQPRNLHISTQYQGQNQEAKYFCPCSPHHRITMKQLIEHHITVHRFISPTYCQQKEES